MLTPVTIPFRCPVKVLTVVPSPGMVSEVFDLATETPAPTTRFNEPVVGCDTDSLVGYVIDGAYLQTVTPSTWVSWLSNSKKCLTDD